MAEDPRNRARERERDEKRKGESSLIFDHFLERVHRRSSDIQRSSSVPLDKSKVYLKTTSPQLQPSPLDQIGVRARD